MSHEVERRIRELTEAGDHEALIELAIELQRAGAFALSEMAARAAAEAGSERGLGALAIALDHQGRFEEAEAVYRASIEAGENASRVQLADMLLHDGARHTELEDLLQPALAEGLPNAHYVLGKLLCRQPGREADAEAAFTAEVHPAIVPLARLALGQLLESIGDEARAEQAYRESDTPDAAMALGGLLRRHAGREREGVEMMRRAAEAGVPNAWNNLTVMLSQLGEAELTEAAFRDALAAGESSLIVHYGEHLRLRGRAAEAEAVLRRGLTSDPACALVLGHMLIGDPARMDEARALLIAAAGQGLVGAALLLARPR